MIAKPNSDNRRGCAHEESTTSRPRSGPHGRPGRAHRGRAHVVSVRPFNASRPLPRCGRACDFYDMANRGAPRLWRAMDGALGLLPGGRALQGRCPDIGRAHRAFPWARHGARYARLSRTGWRGSHSAAPCSAVSELGASSGTAWAAWPARLRRAEAARGARGSRRAPHRHRRDVVQEGPLRHGGVVHDQRLPQLGARGHRQGVLNVPRRAQRERGRHRGGRRRREVKGSWSSAAAPTRGGSWTPSTWSSGPTTRSTPCAARSGRRRGPPPGP